MTLHPRKTKPTDLGKKLDGRPRAGAPFTLGHILGDAVRGAQAAKARRAELDAAGFRAVKGTP